MSSSECCAGAKQGQGMRFLPAVAQPRIAARFSILRQPAGRGTKCSKLYTHNAPAN